MIQRIQTIYYAVAFLLAASPLLGYPLITFMENGDEMQITGYGNNLRQLATIGYETTNFEGTWLYLGSWILMVLLLVTMLSFKNLRRQLLLGKTTFVVYLLAVLLVLLSALGERRLCAACEMTNMWPTIWFYAFAAGLFFVYFGNKGVRKDRKLLDSLNRLR